MVWLTFQLGAGLEGRDNVGWLVILGALVVALKDWSSGC